MMTQSLIQLLYTLKYRDIIQIHRKIQLQYYELGTNFPFLSVRGSTMIFLWEMFCKNDLEYRHGYRMNIIDRDSEVEWK